MNAFFQTCYCDTDLCDPLPADDGDDNNGGGDNGDGNPDGNPEGNAGDTGGIRSLIIAKVEKKDSYQT